MRPSLEPWPEKLTPSEVCAQFRVNSQTLRRWRRNGLISHTRTPGGQPRYDAAEVRALKAASETPLTQTS